MNEKLIKAIMDAEIGSTRLTALPEGTYTLKAEEVTKDGKTNWNIALVGKGKRVPLTPNGLAALRVAKSGADVKAFVTTADANASESVTTLQAALEANEIKLTPTTKFVVVHGLRIIDSISGNPIYQNRHYTGYPAYLAETRKIGLLPNVTPEDAAARRVAYQSATATLVATSKKGDVKEDNANMQLIPIFQITA